MSTECPRLTQKRQDIAASHPPHILKCFKPVLHEYGDLEVDLNFDMLIDYVCNFEERNPVP